MRRVPVGMSASRDEHDTSEEGLQARQTERLDADQFSASADDRDTEPQTAGVRVMLFLVQVYKQGISPLLPGSCRYVPSCSTFAKEAFEQHGVAKGCIMTAWRILRCNPLPYIGGSGYDPVRWPPPGLGSPPPSS